MADLNDNLLNEASEQFVESSHKFVKPVRYFKSNDPYYWEIDNIPIKQLEENILFLRDQVANNLSISGIGRSDLAELRPYVTGFDRVVHVNPGRFTARINDAYNKGINNLNEVYANWRNEAEGGRTQYANNADRKQKEFTLPTSVLKTLAGDIIDQPLLDNGLYTFLQHHNSEPLPLLGGSLEFANSVDNTINPGLDINGLPKTKAAIWRSYGYNYGTTAYQNDLQQESVEFTRFWGGAIRTAIVDVSEPLSISVPDFDETDYSNNTTYNPTTRIDLLFVYSHPVDATSTTIQKPSGASPTTITAPMLGILKGAGVIALNAGNNGVGAGSTNEYTNQPGYFDTTAYAAASGQPANYFSSENTVDANDLNNRIASTMADQTQTQIGLNGSYSNIPSPEDLLNLTPLFEDQLSKDNMALVGQSVLPIAYVIVKRGQVALITNDLFDIRPFMRTAELSYNERAGVAAANPPLSFANPAVGKAEVQKDILDVRDVMMEELNKNILISKPVACGTIFGGTKWGPEGAIASVLHKNIGPTGQLADGGEALQYLVDEGGMYNPNWSEELPLYPGWDINQDYFGDRPAPGEKRNDRLFSTVQFGSLWKAEAAWRDLGNISLDIYTPLYQRDHIGTRPGTQTGHYGNQTHWVHGSEPNWEVTATNGCVFVKKTFIFAPDTLADFDYYDVNVNLLNSSVATNTGLAEDGGKPEFMLGSTQSGLVVSKNGKEGFTIFVLLGPACGHEGNIWFQKPNNFAEDWKGSTMDYWMREDSMYSWVNVHHQAMIDLGSSMDTIDPAAREGGGAGTRSQTVLGSVISPWCVTYPSVNFTVVGYKSDSKIKNYYSTVSTSNSNNIL